VVRKVSAAVPWRYSPAVMRIPAMRTRSAPVPVTGRMRRTPSLDASTMSDRSAASTDPATAATETATLAETTP